MAVFVHRKNQTLHPDTSKLLHRIAERVETQGLEAWWGSSCSDWLGAGASEYDKGTDTLDVWFDSGVVHQCSFKQTEPASIVNGVAPMGDMYLEGSDQHRGWFQSSLLTSVAMKEHAPYRSVLTHGFTVDENGHKMSKSLGNAVAPQKVTKELGADVLRLWVAGSDYSGEITVSPELLKRSADTYRRIRNTIRFLLANLEGFDPAADAVPVSQLVAMDRWAIAGAAKLHQEIAKAYDDCVFHLVYHKLHNYCLVDLGGCYLDVLKDRLYTTAAKSAARRSAQTAMWHILQAMVRWIAPILSFTADEIWRLLPGSDKSTIFSQTWHAFPEVTADDADWPRLLAARESVRKTLETVRAAGVIGSGNNAEIDLYADGDLGKALSASQGELRFWFITSAARVASLAAAPDEATVFTLESGEELRVRALKSEHAKCERCWQQRPDVGGNAEHPTICGRCVDNVTAGGESRRFF
jgi:isoleucyl-tRNA synthetase